MKPINVLLILVGLVLLSPTPGYPEQPAAKIVLKQAVMCESIKNSRPVNPSVVFSISQGEVFCFSEFDPVSEKTHIFHKWYYKDKLISTMRLMLNPPQWSSFSRIQIRYEDRGPWRVEIWDAENTLLQLLRFGMAD